MPLTREIEGALISFCVAQTTHFDASDWEQPHPWDREYTHIAAYLLAGTGAIPRTLPKTLASLPFEDLVAKCRFDCSRFMNECGAHSPTKVFLVAGQAPLPWSWM
jgi:hypothetical protein